MERVNPADVRQQMKRDRSKMLGSISTKELRDGIAKSNARTAVRGMKDLIRGLVEEARPMTPGERMRLQMTAALTETSTRRPSLFNGPKHVYAGTVSAKTKAKRRAANRVARVSRRANR